MKHPWILLIMAACTYGLGSVGCNLRDCTGPDWVEGFPRLEGVYWGIGQAELGKDMEQGKKRAYEIAVGDLAHMVSRVAASNLQRHGAVIDADSLAILHKQTFQEIKTAIAEQKLKGFRSHDSWRNECHDEYYVLVVTNKEHADSICEKVIGQLGSKGPRAKVRKGDEEQNGNLAGRAKPDATVPGDSAAR